MKRFKVIIGFIFWLLIQTQANSRINSESGEAMERKPDRLILIPISQYDSSALSFLPEIAMPEYLYDKTFPLLKSNSLHLIRKIEVIS